MPESNGSTKSFADYDAVLSQYRKALDEARRSLETLGRWMPAHDDEYAWMNMRGYARNRAAVAQEVLEGLEASHD